MISEVSLLDTWEPSAGGGKTSRKPRGYKTKSQGPRLKKLIEIPKPIYAGPSLYLKLSSHIELGKEGKPLEP